MTLPRAVIRGRTYLITRRCSERRFFLRPGPRTNQAFVYELAEAAERFDIEVNGVLAMSNHYHAVVYDPDGNFPRFIQRFHQLVAKTMNARWGRQEALWSSAQTSVVECVDAEDAFDKLVYTLANPVLAHLVDRAVQWPGVTSLPAQLHGRAMTARRPHWFHARDGRMPAAASLTIHRLRGFEHLTEQAWRDKLQRAIAAVEARHAGAKVKGRKMVLRESPHAAPSTPSRRRTLSPRVAARHKERRIEALQRNRLFVTAYRRALAAVRAGREALFPQGTYELARLGLVRCVPPA